MAANQNPRVSAGGGGFLQVLGIIYLVKLIRRRRRERQLRAGAGQPGQAEPRAGPARWRGRLPG
jgi:hypothetical protein